jgi:hypothetical protein
VSVLSKHNYTSGMFVIDSLGKSFMSMGDIVALIDAANPMPAKRGPYKKREAA